MPSPSPNPSSSPASESISAPPQRILVCGYYGFGNAGDDAILSVLIGDLRDLYPHATITVLAGAPPALQADYGIEAIDWLDIPATIRAAREADLMVLGGGGLFQDHQGFDPGEMLTRRQGGISYYAGFALLSTLAETPLAIYGIGVGPLFTDEGRQYTSLAFGQATAAAVRDEASLAVLTAAGHQASVEVSADPAWRLEAAPADIVPGILELESAPEAPRTIGVAVRPWGEAAWAEPLAAALDALVEELDARIVFVPFQESPHRHENDANAALEVIRRMERTDRTVNLRGGYSARERKTILGACDLVIGMRLHSVIFAASAGVPVVALSYDPKVTSTMNDLGAGDLVLDVDTLTAAAVTAAAQRALSNGDREQIAEAVVDLSRRAEANRDVLTAATEGPRPGRDPASVDALMSLAFARIEEQAGSEGELTQLRYDHRMLELASQHLEKDRDALQTDRADIINSRAYRLVANYWRTRDGIRRAAAAGSKRAPEALRPALERFSTTEPTEAAVWEQGDPRLRAQLEAQLEEILDIYQDVPGIIVYPPSIGWTVSLFQRPQQMALAFARLGYLVFYGLDHVNNEKVLGFRQEAPRLYLTAVPPTMTDLLEMIPDPISVTYVYNFGWTKLLKDPAVVFEHIDELEVFTAAHRLSDLESWYREAISGADLVVATAADLLDKVRVERPEAVLSPNGVDYRHFAEYVHGAPPEDIADIADKTIVGYYGAIAEWVDYDLIRRSAQALPDFEFVFLGPDYDGSVDSHRDIFDLPNVRWLGVKKYGELPAYLNCFDVATIPFVINEVTHAVSPLKLFEYFAGGRPVVTPNLRECARYEAVMVATDADDYIAKLQEAAALTDDPDHQALLRRTARANTWEMRAGTLIDALARSHH